MEQIPTNATRFTSIPEIFGNGLIQNSLATELLNCATKVVKNKPEESNPYTDEHPSYLHWVRGGNIIGWGHFSFDLIEKSQYLRGLTRK